MYGLYYLKNTRVRADRHGVLCMMDVRPRVLSEMDRCILFRAVFLYGNGTGAGRRPSEENEN